MTTQTEALKPCPFCGGEAELIIDNDHHGEFFQLGCKDKKCLGHWAYYTESIAETPVSEAIAHWNTRALAQQNPQGVSNEQVEPCEYCKRGLKTMCLCGINAKAIHQFRSPPCADWYDGIPDHHDGHGPYEVRTLYTHPPVPTAQPETPYEVGQRIAKTGGGMSHLWSAVSNDGELAEAERGFKDAQPKEPAVAEQHKQEPVAWIVGDDLTIRADWVEGLNWKGSWVDVGRAIPNQWTPVLYTTPPQRPSRSDMTWVGLTDEERNQLWNDWENGHVVEAAEAKLREKNNEWMA